MDKKEPDKPVTVNVGHIIRVIGKATPKKPRKAKKKTNK